MCYCRHWHLKCCGSLSSCCSGALCYNSLWWAAGTALPGVTAELRVRRGVLGRNGMLPRVHPSTPYKPTRLQPCLRGWGSCRGGRGPTWRRRGPASALGGKLRAGGRWRRRAASSGSCSSRCGGAASCPSGPPARARGGPAGTRWSRGGGPRAGEALCAPGGLRAELCGAVLQRLRAAVHYTTGCLCQGVAEDKGVLFSKQTVAAISEITFRQCGTSACYLAAQRQLLGMGCAKRKSLGLSVTQSFLCRDFTATRNSHSVFLTSKKHLNVCEVLAAHLPLQQWCVRTSCGRFL